MGSNLWSDTRRRRFSLGRDADKNLMHGEANSALHWQGKAAHSRLDCRKRGAGADAAGHSLLGPLLVLRRLVAAAMCLMRCRTGGREMRSRRACTASHRQRREEKCQCSQKHREYAERHLSKVTRGRLRLQAGAVVDFDAELTALDAKATSSGAAR